MVEKRAAADGSAGDNDAKRMRTDGAAPAAAPAPAAGALPKPGGAGLSLEALEKAKRALQLQKELKEKLKALPLQKPAAGAALAAGAAAGAPALPASAAAAAVAKAAEVAARFGLSVTPAAAAAPRPAALPLSLGAGAAGGAFKPAPLRLDALGREVDEFGNLVQKAVMPVTTLKVNQAAAKPAASAVAGTASVLPGALRAGAASVAPGAASVMPGAAAAPQPEATDAFFDPRMGARGRGERRRKATFDFVQEGAFQRAAESVRLKAKYGDDALRRPRAPPGPIGAEGNPNLIPVGVNPNLIPIGGGVSGEGKGVPPQGVVPSAEEAEDALEAARPIPDVEWWDKGLLADGRYAPEDDAAAAEAAAGGSGGDVAMDGAGSGPQLKEAKITHYVEHPVPIEPPREAPPPPPQPLKLTAKELKKLRTQRRQAREKEKQELIRQGLLEPPKPKVRISNLYRVLGEQAVADPTALEMEARKQMAERQAAHDDRNLSRMLTPAERRDKKNRKLFDEDGGDVVCSVYKVSRLDNPQHRFKVDVNAKENRMTGMCLVTPEFALVVVEGCGKSTKRYAKLMLRRIDWSSGPGGDDEEEEEEEEEKADKEEDKGPCVCDLVWQGAVPERAFKDFKVDANASVERAQQVLAQHRVGHYWDVARNFVREEAPPVTL